MLPLASLKSKKVKQVFGAHCCLQMCDQIGCHRNDVICTSTLLCNQIKCHNNDSYALPLASYNEEQFNIAEANHSCLRVFYIW